MPLALDAILSGLPAAISGEFELERELGRGGMGVVFLARDVRLDRHVALKVLPPYPGRSADIRERFLREARTAGQLSHPNIVPIHRADERGGYAFFAMGLVDGVSLGQRVKDRGPLPPGDVVRHLREVAWALAYAHARGVIHRDVKPENIMIEHATNRALVTDFGIARSERASGLTSEGHILGTAHFMSPEQIQGLPIDGRSDLYSLGVVGYYLLSGRLPFEGDATTAVLVAHITRPAPSLLSIAPTVPRALAAVIDRCLTKDPSQRYETGEALADALGKAMDDVAEPAEQASDRHTVLSEAQAAAVWHRAAQLQAEAAARLERDTRSQVSSTQGGDAPASEASSGVPATSTFRVRDVEAAAIEAGISQRFVALALSELPRDTAMIADVAGIGLRERVGTSLLRELQRSISVSRVIRGSARDVLKALGSTFQGQRFRMTLRDTVGPHPLDGGILVFTLPEMDENGQATHAFRWLYYGLGAKELRATLRPVDRDRESWEVTVIADLRRGLAANVWGYSGLSFGLTATTASVGGMMIAKALALGGALIAGPVAAIGLASAPLIVAGARATYRWEGRKATRELEALLDAINGTLRSVSISDEEPLPRLPRSAAMNMTKP